jgi:hypothetical protein
MKHILGAALVGALVVGLGTPARAGDDKDVKTVLDKAVKALGGKEKLSKLKAYTYKTKGTINFGGNESEFAAQVTVQGLRHHRNEFEGDIGGNKIKGVFILAGDKGWFKFNEDVKEMEKDGVASHAHTVLMEVVPATLLPLRGKDLKVTPAGETKVGGKAAVGLAVTGPGGKQFKIYFDKDSGLPVKVTGKTADFMGAEHDQETTFEKYKDFDGVKKATRVVTRQDGEPFISVDVTEFRPLEAADKKAFAEPK